MSDRELAPATRRERLRRLVAPLAVGIVALAWAGFIWSQLDALRAYAWRITPAALLGAVLLSAAYYIALALCWALLLRRMRAERVPYMLAARVWLLSMVSRYIPGNVWHILSRALMAQRLGVSRTAVVASATIEQGLTILAALGITAVTLPLWRAGGTAPALLATVVVATLVGLVCLHPRILGALLAWASVRLRRPELAWSYRYRDILALAAAFAFAHLCSGLALVSVLAGVAGVDPAILPLVVGAAAAAWVVGYLSLLTPSGLGVREGALVGLLALVVPLPVATIASLLFRVAITLGELLAVLLFWAGGALARQGQRQ
ncbi:MAG TPA: lysylphosphatidylglycerol synthase domain-containing protein [Roseiflexaceae bacterium]|nr:lysylphosphatidylglycerol synthase domain-containing protein [Roseiflexaceae bacterium]